MHEKSAAPAQPAQQPHEIKITLPTISLRFDEKLRKRLPLLLIIAVLFIFSCILFDKANLRIIDVFDLTRIAGVYGKLFSFAFILFAVLFALALAFAMFYANGATSGTALLVLPATLLPAISLWLFMPKMGLVFAAFSLGLTLAALLTVREQQLDLQKAWKVARRSLALLLLCAVVICALKVWMSQDAYANILFTSLDVVVMKDAQLSGMLSGAGGSAAPLISEDQIKSAITKNDVENALAKSAVFNEATHNMTAQQKSLLLIQLEASVEDLAYAKVLQATGAGQLPAGIEGGGVITHYAEASDLGKAVKSALPIAIIPIVWTLGAIALFFVRGIAVATWYALVKL